MDRLSELFTRQTMLQATINGYTVDDPNMSDEMRIEHIKENVLACTAELHEALDEVGWKKWTESRHINHDALRNEIIDAFHFILNLALHAGMGADEFFDRFVAKNEKNLARQLEGYDGVAEKCPHCRRALDDVGIGQGRILNELVFTCGHCNKGLPAEQVLGSSLLTQLVRTAKIMNQT